jgi:hypothetical protein
MSSKKDSTAAEYQALQSSKTKTDDGKISGAGGPRVGSGDEDVQAILNKVALLISFNEDDKIGGAGGPRVGSGPAGEETTMKIELRLTFANQKISKVTSNATPKGDLPGDE